MLPPTKEPATDNKCVKQLSDTSSSSTLTNAPSTEGNPERRLSVTSIKSALEQSAQPFYSIPPGESLTELVFPDDLPFFQPSDQLMNSGVTITTIDAITGIEESQQERTAVPQRNPVEENLATNISFKALISSYCRGDDEFEEQELRDLLTEWEVPCQQHFIDEGLFLPVLKIAEPFFIKRFLEKLNITTGSKIVFFDKWQSWKMANVPLRSTSSGKKEKELPVPSSSTSSAVLPNKSLIAILNCNDGETIKNYYKQHGNIENKTVRFLLLDTILAYAITYDLHFTPKDLAKLAEEIQNTFKEDALDYYHLPRGIKNAKGKLANKFHNYRARSRNVTRFFPLDQNNKTRTDIEPTRENPADSEKLLLKIKHDFQVMNATEKIDAWERTFNARQDDLAKANTKELPWDQFYEKWHFISLSNCYEYIESDFNRMFGNKDDVLAGTKITEFCDFMLQNGFPKLIANSEICNKLHDFNIKRLSNQYTITQNAIGAIVFSYVQHILQPTARDGYKRFSVQDSQEASIRVFALAQDYKEHQNALAGTRSNSQPPVISIIGSLEKVEEIHIDFDNVHYKMFTFERAIDICLKTFFTLNMSYPKPCENFWQFIDMHFYKIDKAATNTKARKLIRFLASANV